LTGGDAVVSDERPQVAIKAMFGRKTIANINFLEMNRFFS
jgi:hypothetical protein